MSGFSSRWLAYAPAEDDPSETPAGVADKTTASLEPAPAEPPPAAPVPAVGTLSRLPWQLEALFRAASSDLLPKDPLMLPSGLVPDMNRYTLAWAASYLVGDRQEALSRLWQVRRAWQKETPS